MGSEAAWLTAILVVVVSLLSTFTLSRPQEVATAGGGPQSFRRGPGSGAGAGDGELVDGELVDGEFVDGEFIEGEFVDGEFVEGEGGLEGTAVGTGGGAGGGASSGGAGGGAGGAGSGGAGGGGPGGQSGAGADCAKGQNAGATDWGVTNNEINMAATVVTTGVAKSFLFDAQFGMQAVIRKVNSQGGICGRALKVKTDNDGWDPSEGRKLIERYIGCKCYLGLAVNPSSEGLRQPIDSGLVDRNRFPVVGADGMLIQQYTNPWVWPVATSTHSVMHVVAAEAIARGARKAGIVWENSFRFGTEGAAAFKGAFGREGGTIVEQAEIKGGQSSYATEARAFVDGCSNSGSDFAKCDFVALVLEPATASQWVRNGGLGNGNQHPQFGLGAPQPLFLNAFANDCGAPCNGLRVWTSFKPPISPFDSEPAVATYRGDVRAVSSAADTNNPHVQGAYQGMLLVVEALKRLGPAPTREGLRQALDSMTLDTGLTRGPQTWQSGNHFAAVEAAGFDAIYNGNSFTGWRFNQQVGFQEDKEVGKDA